MILKSQAILLAKFIEALRPGWHFHGIMAAIGAAANRGPAGDLAIAMITAAITDADTPAAITNPVYWPQIGPTAEQDRQAQYRADVARAKADQLRAEYQAARAAAATPDQIRAIREGQA